jgi:23S rRNA (cytidine1920-2'-O)/16S rRNA (cytidine1409-2'-O)-methyltransferase
MARIRADQLLAERGLAESRAKAQALILAGLVFSGERKIDKAGQALAADAPLSVRGKDHPWVSRGGIKLAHAIDHFGWEVAGLVALDVGASTGGFTDVLLQRGAASVIAIDVGRGQLDWKLRTDPRVLVRDGVNARALTAADVPHIVSLVVIDVAFISLRHILPALPPFLALPADIVALVKPQFEAGRDEVGKHGIVSDPAVHAAVIARVTEAAEACGLARVAMAPSAITGATGNQEFFLHLHAR